MSSVHPASSAASTLFGKTRQAVLNSVFRFPDQWHYLRQLARTTASGLGAVQRELKHLTQAGILEKQAQGRQVLYRVNRRSPIFPELQSLVVKTSGVADVLRSALDPLSGQIVAAFVHGSWTRGAQQSGSDVDVVIVGEVGFRDVVSALAPAQKTLGRDVNPSVYSAAEFTNKLAQGHHFLSAVYDEPKIYLIGDDRELERLAQQRVGWSRTRQASAKSATCSASPTETSTIARQRG